MVTPFARLVVILTLSLLPRGECQQTRDDPHLACIEEMLLPGYGSIARKADAPDTVTAHIIIGPDAKPSKILTDSVQPFLSKEVEVFLKYNTQYRQDCHGEVITLRFTFVLSGSPSRAPTTRVRFRGPNEFVIESQPQAPIVDVFPRKPDE